MKKKIILSGINLFQGGPLSIYTDFLDEILLKKINDKYEIILFVHKVELFSKYKNYFEMIEVPKSRKNWLYRLYYEYVYFKRYSKQRNIFLWISLHDMTPNVRAEHLITYCHNPTFSYKANSRDFKLDKKLFLFSKFYKYLYGINIHKNDFLIVQQDWIAQAFHRLYELERKKIIVFPPCIPELENKANAKKSSNIFTFFYPTFPRVFKNLEIICEAAKILEMENSLAYKIIFTIDGTENKYAKELYDKYASLSTVQFRGVLTREKTFEQYRESDCLLFTSKLETWGLPISEAKSFDLPMIVSDLPYAHETVGNYKKVKFINENDSVILSQTMKAIITNHIDYDGNDYKIENDLFSETWEKIINLIDEGD